MAASTASAISGIGGLALGGYQAFSGAKNARDARRAIDNYDRQDLTNAFENIQIPTAGVDLMREEAQRSNANLVDAARQSGTRGVIGAIPQIVGQNNMMNRQTAAYLDDLFSRRDYATAQDNVNIRNMQEQRENADIAGLGQQLQTGRQDFFSGLTGLASTASYVGNNLQGTDRGYVQGLGTLPQVQPIMNQQPITASPYNPFGNFRY